jgi:hypothetical protein
MSRLLVLCLFCYLIGCNNKKNEEESKSGYFPVLSFIESQVAHVDTSLYAIIKIVTTAESSDTQYLRRENFKQVSDHFLNIPDITKGKLADKYVELKMYDESLAQVILNYTPKDDDLEIQRQEVLIKPNPVRDVVTTIYIDQLQNFKDSTVLKKMLWRVNKRFKVVSIIQKENQPEKVITEEVIWNDFLSDEQ